MDSPSDVSRQPDDLGSVAPGAQVRVRVDHLDVGYRPGEEILHGVSIDVEPGEILSLLGPSGCGKTTLLRAIAGLQRPESGVIEIGDRIVDGHAVHVEPHRRRVGMVFQNGALFPHLTVAENVVFGLRNHPAPRQRADEMLELVELEGFADRLPDTLSGGQRQRVALARALAPNPAVLLLDEPFTALDAGMRNQIRRDVKRILQQIGITTIVVTHDQDEAFVFGDRVALMRAGSVIQVGPSTELYDRPRSRWVADFVGETNVVPGRLEPVADQDQARHVSTGFGRLRAEVISSTEVDGDWPAEVLIRPEQFDVLAAGSDRQAGDVEAVVEGAEYFGHDVLYALLIDGSGADGERLLVRTTDASFGPGDSVVARFRGRHVIVWPAVSAGR